MIEFAAARLGLLAFSRPGCTPPADHRTGDPWPVCIPMGYGSKVYLPTYVRSLDG